MVTFKYLLLIVALLSLLFLTFTSPDSIAVVKGELGANGWYVSDVLVRWKLPEGAVVQSGCLDTVINYDTAGTELSCAYRKSSQELVSETLLVKRDTTPPTPFINVPFERPFMLDEGEIFRLDGSNSTDNLSTVNYDVERNPYTRFGNRLVVKAFDGMPGEIVWRFWDEAGNETTVTTEMLVQNVAPSVQSLEYIAFEDGWVTLELLIADPGVWDTHTVTIDWGDGVVKEVVAQNGGVTALHEYSDPEATYRLTVTVMDNDGGVGETARTVTPVEGANE